MNILAIDTATDKFSVAVSSGTETFLFEADAGLRHSELVMEAVDLLMRKAGMKPQELSGVVCMGGPGSFTGLRIGFSTTKGLALSLGIPLAPIPTLDCMAWPFAGWPGIVVPAIDAKKGAFFCALYRGLYQGGNGLKARKLCPDMDAAPPEIAGVIQTHQQAGEPVLLTGPGAAMLYDEFAATGLSAGIKPEQRLRWGNAKTLLAMAAETGILTNGAANPDCGPEYIRKSDAELKR